MRGDMGNVSKVCVSFDQTPARFEERVNLELDLHSKANLKDKLEDVLVKIKFGCVSGLQLGHGNTDFFESTLNYIEQMKVTDIRKDQLAGVRFRFDSSGVRFVCHSFRVEVEVVSPFLAQ